MRETLSVQIEKLQARINDLLKNGAGGSQEHAENLEVVKKAFQDQVAFLRSETESQLHRQWGIAVSHSDSETQPHAPYMRVE